MWEDMEAMDKERDAVQKPEQKVKRELRVQYRFESEERKSGTKCNLCTKHHETKKHKCCLCGLTGEKSHPSTECPVFSQNKTTTKKN